MVEDTLSVPEFNLPASSFVKDESRELIDKRKKEVQEKFADVSLSFDWRNIPVNQLAETRQRLINLSKSLPVYSAMQNRYPTVMTEETIEGVYIEVFTPAGGVATKNKDKVLINLHGGSFIAGERSGSHIESIPISVVGEIKVISVDYRMAPEYQFPAASDDVLVIYKYLLKHYKPENIGIYGSSAGALLTAQATARFQSEGLAPPGAVAMLAAGAFYWMEGDSSHIASAISEVPGQEFGDDLYFKGANSNDPLVFPGRDAETMANFPPSLMVASTRDCALSSVVNTHRELVKQGVVADLHIWDGLDHMFYLDGEMSESREVYDVVVRFFETHLRLKQ